MSAIKDVYVIATESTEPVSDESIREAFEGDEVEMTFGENGQLFSLKADGAQVDVRFESREKSLGWTPDLLTGSQELREFLEKAVGFYKVAFEPGKPQTSVAVFEALWAVRTMLELTAGVVVDVMSFKIHGPEDIEEITELDFDIRDHLTIHAMEIGEKDKTQYWVHTHGMAKFGQLDVEMFNIGEDDLAAAETFFHELCTDLAFGQGPQARAVIATSVGLGFTLLPADEARPHLYGVDPETYEGHEGKYLTVVSPEGKHNLAEILEHYRERFEDETEEEAEALREHAKKLLPVFKARYQRKGLMEPLTFVVRAPFEVHPDGEAGEPEEEMLWAEVVSWDDDTLIGKLVDGGRQTTEWRKGAHAEIDETQVNAIAVSRDGRTMDPEELDKLLLAERPA